jgi:putative transposase
MLVLALINQGWRLIMKKKRYSEDQIIKILKEVGAGVELKDVTRKYGISPVTYYRWKSKFDGLTVSDAKRLKALEDENRKLKRLLADSLLDNAALKDVVGKKW